MFDKEEYQKAYDYIEQNKTNELFQSHYIRWRIARLIPFIRINQYSSSSLFQLESTINFH